MKQQAINLNQTLNYTGLLWRGKSGLVSAEYLAAIKSYKSRDFEYKVLNSCIGSIYVAPGVSNTEACLRAVDECDFFFGIILPRYGSGITHEEFTRA